MVAECPCWSSGLQPELHVILFLAPKLCTVASLACVSSQK